MKFNNIGEVLNYIQVNLNAPKNQFNKFGGYAYRSCEDILSALKPLLKETGAYLVIEDGLEEINGRIYIKATAKLYFKDGVVSTTAYAREPESKKGMDEAQITGASSSYARKYALNGLFAIDDTKDPDFTNTHGKETKTANTVEKTAKKQKKSSEKATDKVSDKSPNTAESPKEKVSFDDMAKLRRQLFTVIKKNNRDQNKFKEWIGKEYGVESTKDLKAEDLKYIIGGIEHGYWKEEF